MIGRRSPTALTDNPQSLALIGQGLCPCRGDRHPGPGLTEPCGLPIDQSSQVHMCTGHDRAFQQIWPQRYEELTGLPARAVWPDTPTPAEIAEAEQYLSGVQHRGAGR